MERLVPGKRPIRLRIKRGCKVNIFGIISISEGKQRNV